MILKIDSTKEILEQNKICIFCKSELVLTYELALTKINHGFYQQGDYLIFKSDPTYFNYARIDLNTDEFQINRTNKSAFYINYKSVNFLRKCFNCSYDFTIRYGKYKFTDKQGNSTNFGKPSLESISFKYIKTPSVVLVTNNYLYNDSKIVHLTFENKNFLELKKEVKVESVINFDYSNIESIKNKIESILLFF